MAGMNNQSFLYYQNQYIREFEAGLVSTESGKEGVEVLLENTAFYPGGGGQPADRGTLGGLPVLSLRKEGGKVYHLLPKKPEGLSLTGVLDWDFRYHYMVQHTGQHLLSAVAYREKGWNTLAVHFGEKETTIEMDIKDLPEEDAYWWEDAGNRFIRKNLPLTQSWIKEEVPQSMDLRRAPSVKGDIRVISLGDYDSAPCGGIHTKSTGELKLFIWGGSERIRGHIRSYWHIGDSAVALYRENLKTLKNIGSLLSLPADKVFSGVENLREQAGREAATGRAYREDAVRIWAEFLIKERENAKAPLTYCFRDRERGFIRLVAEEIRKTALFPLALLNISADTAEWLIAADNPCFSFDKAREELMKTIDGKGGGKTPFWQGVGKNPKGADSFFDSFIKALSEII